MKKFLLIYHTESMPANMPAPTPEQMKTMMDTWMAWSGKLGTGIVDLGNPLNPSAQRISPQGTLSISSTETGYSMIQADDMASAVKMMEGHPLLHQPGATIVIHEVTPMPGM